MNEASEERKRIVEGQTRETGDHFHGHSMPWEMAKVARFGDCTILVWANDRMEEPHFHVVRGEDLLEPKFDTALKIRTAEYCPHEGKSSGHLEDEELEGLVELLNAKDECAGGEHTVWQSLIGVWNSNNEKRAIPLTTPMPDYRHIHWKLSERPKRGTTELPDGRKMVYNGDLTVLDKDGEFVSWMAPELVGMLFDEEVDCGAVVERPTWVWVETGVALERYLLKHGGYAVPNAFAAGVLGKPLESIEWRDDGFHYRRVPDSGGEGVAVTKAVLGFRDEAAARKAFEAADGDIRREHFRLQSFTPDAENPDESCCAVAFENQLYDLCWEEGFRDLTPGLARDLEKTIGILERCNEQNPKGGNLLASTRLLRKVMPEIRLLGAGAGAEEAENVE
jgi:hypothetical protein